MSNPTGDTIDASLTSNSGGFEDGFEWLISTDNVNFTSSGTTVTGVTTFQYTGLDQDVTYYGKAIALGNIDSDFSNTDNLATILQAPSDFTFSNPTESTIDATITSNSIGFETGFEWFLSENNIAFVSVGTTGTGVTSFQYDNLNDGTLYYGKATATGNVDSDFSNTDSESTTAVGFLMEVDLSLGDADTTFELALDATATQFPVTIFWGDGTDDTIANNSDPALDHVYPISGTYDISTTGVIAPNMSASPDDGKVTEIKSFADSVVVAFSYFSCENMNVTATDTPSTVTANVRDVFFQCGNLTWNSSVNNFDTGTATSLTQFFAFCPNFNQDVSGWDMTNVTGITGIFNGCSSFNQDVSGWGSTRDSFPSLSGLFQNCTSFDQNLSWIDYSGISVSSGLNLFVTNSNLSSANYNAMLAKMRSDAEGAGILNGLTLGANGLVATGQGVTDRTWLITNTSMTIIDATP